MKKISIVASCYNEEENLNELYNRLCIQIDKFKDKYEFDFIFLDNGSTDKTSDVLRELAKNDKRVKVIINSRNFGHIRSPFYGITLSDSDAVFLTASDLQDPPELLPEVIQKWEEGNEIVLLQKNRSKENGLMFLLRKLYYFILYKITDNGVTLAQNCTGAGLIDKKIVEEIKKVDDPLPYYRGLLCEMGFNRAYVTFEQPTRTRGISANNFYTLYDIGMLGVVKFSKMPLRIMAFFGFIISVFTFIMSIVYLLFKIIYWNSFSLGIAPIIISILFLGSIQLFCLGLLGEYIGAIYTRVDKKPLVIEKERINF